MGPARINRGPPSPAQARRGRERGGSLETEFSSWPHRSWVTLAMPCHSHGLGFLIRLMGPRILSLPRGVLGGGVVYGVTCPQVSLLRSAVMHPHRLRPFLASGLRGRGAHRPSACTQRALCWPGEQQAGRRGLLFLLVDSSLRAFGLSANNNSSGTLYSSASRNL